MPEIIAEYSKLTSYKKGDEVLHLYLREINSIPKEYRNSKLSSKGFFDEITVQDFPIRGKVTKSIQRFFKRFYNLGAEISF